MKKNSIHPSLVVLLFLASFSSYVFLNTLSTPPCELADEAEKVELVDLGAKETIMPDVAIVKRVFEFFKHMVPVSK